MLSTLLLSTVLLGQCANGTCSISMSLGTRSYANQGTVFAPPTTSYSYSMSMAPPVVRSSVQSQSIYSTPVYSSEVFAETQTYSLSPAPARMRRGLFGRVKGVRGGGCF